MVAYRDANTLLAQAFTAWLNSHLRKREIQVEDITKDFEDGLSLIAVMEVDCCATKGRGSSLKVMRCLQLLTHESVGKYKKEPKNQIHKMNNLNIALALARKHVRVTCDGTAL